MKRITLIYILIVLASRLVVAQTAHFIPSDRFSSSLVADICQDKYGYLWIATDYGLNRHDGYQFDKQGRLWVGTNRGLDRFDEGANGFVHYVFPDSVRPRISDLIQLSDGRILVATAGYGAYTVGDDERLKATDVFADAHLNTF